MTVFQKAGIALEVVILPMLEDEDASLLQQAVAEHERRDFPELGQRIRRVGEDEVELFAATLHEAEHISPHRQTLVRLQLLHHFADKRIVLRILLHSHHSSTPT